MEVHGSKIYVSDPGIKGLEIIDLEKHTFRNFIPTGKGELQLPLNCVVDANENLYVADGKRFQIVIFDKTGKYLNCLGEIDNFKPTDVFVTDSLVLVTNLKNNKINVYDKNSLKLKYSFPDVESGDEGYLYSPTNLCAADGKIYVTDFGDFKIKIYDIKGTYIRSVGTYGNALGQMARPKGIAVDKESNLFVVDAGFDNTQIFDKNGKLLMYFGGPYKGPGYMWLPASVAIDYTNMNYFQKFVDESYTLKYLIYVTNQYGPEKVNVYGMIESKKNKTH